VGRRDSGRFRCGEHFEPAGLHAPRVTRVARLDESQSDRPLRVTADISRPFLPGDPHVSPPALRAEGADVTGVARDKKSLKSYSA